MARYVPHREEFISQALCEFGIIVSPQKIAPSIAIADRYLIEESAASPMRLRSREEQAKVYTRYQQMVFTKAGVSFPNSDALLPHEEAYQDTRLKGGGVSYDRDRELK